MGDRVREIVYFDKPGKANTGKVVAAVAARLAVGDIDTVIEFDVRKSGKHPGRLGAHSQRGGDGAAAGVGARVPLSGS